MLFNYINMIIILITLKSDTLLVFSLLLEPNSNIMQDFSVIDIIIILP